MADLIRETFEASMADNGMAAWELEELGGGDYRHPATQLSWEVWQAAWSAALASAPSAAIQTVNLVAVIRFDRNTPGNENEMPRVVSCIRLPDGEYPVYAAPLAQEAETQRKPLSNKQLVACIEAAGFRTWDSRMWTLKREIERAHGIGVPNAGTEERS